MNEMSSFDQARQPRDLPGPQSVMAVDPPDPLCPQKKARLQHAMSDSYSCGWVQDEVEKLHRD